MCWQKRPYCVPIRQLFWGIPWWSVTAGPCPKAESKLSLYIPEPKDKKQVRELLGTVEYCRLWIPTFAEIAKPLNQNYEEMGP